MTKTELATVQKLIDLRIQNDKDNAKLLKKDLKDLFEEKESKQEEQKIGFWFTWLVDFLHMMRYNKVEIT